MQHVVALSREVHSAAHFLYRLKYLRDILLHPTIDDPGVSAINSMITFTSTEIASSVLADEAVIIAVLTYLLPTPAAAVPSSSSDTHCDDLHSNKTGNHEVPSSSSSANQSLHHTTSTSTAVSSSSGGSSDLEDKVQERVKVVNAVLFIRELFVLSKFVPLDKRMEIYRHFFAVHQKLFTSAVVYVLGGVSLMLRHDAEVYNSLHHASQTSPTQSQIPISESSPDDMHSFVKHFTYEEGLLACNAMAEVLSVISIVYPMAIRQMILTQSCHPAATKTSSGTSTTTTTSSIIRVEDGQQVDLSNKSQQPLAATALWYRQSLFYLLIDLLVNGIDIACLDFLGDCIRQVLDFDKIHALNTLFCAANNPRGGNPNALHNNPNNPNNHVNTHYISSKLDKETLLKLFYDHYIVFFFVIVNDDLTHNSSNSSSSNSNNTMKSVPSKYYVDKHQVSFQLDDSLQQDMTSYLPCTPQSTHAFVTSRRLIVDIFVLCLQQHSYRIKYCLLHGSYIHKFVYKSFPYVANTDSTGNALTTSHTTTTSNNRTLQVYIIKFLKAILLTKDEFYFKHIVKLDVLKPIFMTLQQVTHRDNLLTSAIYDLLDTIRQENIAVLMRYVVEKYHEVCEKITLVEVYDSLRLKHEQHLERSQVSNKMEEEDIENQGAAGGGAKKRGREGTAWRRREEEEDYFNSDDNESVDDDLLGIRWSGSQQDFGKRSRGDSSQSSPSTTSGIYARPPSPPHYNRLHGNELDGEGHSTIHGSSAPVSSPLTAIGDAMSIISQYADDDLSSQENDVPSEMTIEEVDSDASSTVTSSAVMTLNQEDFPTELELPPLSKKHEDDEVDELSLFLGHNRKKDTPTQDSTTSTSTSNIGNGISFVMLKKKPIITFSNKP